MQLIAKSQNGDVQAQETLLNKYKPLVIKNSRKFFLLGADEDDLLQEGMIGLYKACMKYDMNKVDECSFAGFASLCISRQIQTAVKTANSKKNKILTNRVSLNHQGGVQLADAAGNEEIQFILPSPTLSPEEQVISSDAANEMKKQILAALSKFEIQVLNLYLAGMKYDEISQLLGKPKKSIDNALSRLKNKLEFIRKG